MDTRRWAVFLAGAAAFVNLYAPQSLLPLLRQWMGSNAALAGLVISAGTAGVALAAPISGWLADRYGRQRMIVGAAFLTMLPTLAMSFAQTPTQLILLRFAEGLALPAVFAVTTAYIADEWPATQARAVTALYVAGTVVGGFSGRFVAGFVAEFHGWRLALAALALLQLLLALALRLWLPRERCRRAGTAINPLRLFADRRLSSTYAAGSAILFALIATFTYVSLRLSAAPFHLGPAALSAIFAVYLIGAVVTPLAGRALNAFGHARTLTLAWAVAIAGLGLTLPSSLSLTVLGLSLFSTALFIAQTTVISFIGEAAPAATRGAAMGMYVTCYYIGGSVGGVLPAMAWNAVGWPGVVSLSALAGAISVWIAWQVFRPGPLAAATTTTGLPTTAVSASGEHAP